MWYNSWGYHPKGISTPEVLKCKRASKIHLKVKYAKCASNQAWIAGGGVGFSLQTAPFIFNFTESRREKSIYPRCVSARVRKIQIDYLCVIISTSPQLKFISFIMYSNEVEARSCTNSLNCPIRYLKTWIIYKVKTFVYILKKIL